MCSSLLKMRSLYIANLLDHICKSKITTSKGLAKRKKRKKVMLKELILDTSYHPLLILQYPKLLMNDIYPFRIDLKLEKSMLHLYTLVSVILLQILQIQLFVVHLQHV